MKRNILFLLLFLCICWTTPLTISGDEGTDLGASSSEPQQMMDFDLAGYGSKGQKMWQVQGASMDMLGNEVKISDITAHLYGEKENMILTADRGHFDKDKGVVHLSDNVHAVTDGGAQLKTDSLEWSQKEQLIKTQDQVNIAKDNITAQAIGIEAKPDFKIAQLEKDVVVTIEEQKKVSDAQAATDSSKSKIVITCDGPMELNYDKNFAVFHKNVKVEGDAEQGTMHADQMTIYFSKDNKQIDKIEAEGNVKIIRQENTSLSEGAVFTASDKKLILTGRPQLVVFSQEDFNVSP